MPKIVVSDHRHCSYCAYENVIDMYSNTSSRNVRWLQSTYILLMRPEWRSRYSDILRVVRSRVRTPVRTGPEANPSILYNGHRLSCLEVQRGVEHPPHLAPECGYCDTSACHHVSIRHVTGQTSPFSIWLSVSWTKRKQRIMFLCHLRKNWMNAVTAQWRCLLLLKFLNTS
jgi:hypothetical protein